jgi:phage terminase large subunit-like protein
VACFRDYGKLLAPGERAIVLVLASDRRQARVVFDYIRGFLRGIPMLERMIERETREEIHLSNCVALEVHACSFKGVRGYTLAGAILDEVAFWSSEEDGANPDREVVRALKPGLSTIPGAPLIAISSPYARRGELWNAYRRFYRVEDSPTLVWQAARHESELAGACRRAGAPGR